MNKCRGTETTTLLTIRLRGSIVHLTRERGSATRSDQRHDISLCRKFLLLD